MITKTTLEVPNESALVPIIRRAAVQPLREFGVTEDDIDRVATIITEACSNVCKYAYESRGEYSVYLEYHAERINITIMDHGQGFDPAEIEPPKSGQIGGYGLSLIRKSADTADITSIENECTIIRARVLLRYRSTEYREQARRLIED